MILKEKYYRFFMVLFVCLTCLNLSGQVDLDIILKSRALTGTGKAGMAISLLSDAIDKTKESLLYAERAEANIIINDLSNALRDFNEANRLSPMSGEFGLAKVYSMKGDAATALYHLEIHMNSPFRKSEKEILLDPAFENVENRSEWRQFWKKEWYSPEEKSISEIEFYTSAGKIDESRAVLSQLRKDYPESTDILYAEALISQASGKYSEAVNSLLKLSVIEPLDEKKLKLLAKAQLGQSNPAGASVTYSKLLEYGVADAELLIMRAGCYRKTGETVKALADIEKYLGLYPEDKAAISLAGKVESESGDNLKALEYFSMNLKLNPNDPECYTDRANSYFISRSWDLAIMDYSMSLDLKPENPEAWLNKGIALIGSGKVDDACHDFKRSYYLGNQKASAYLAKHCLNK